MASILINGESQSTVSVFDRGLHYGDGVFETIKVVQGRAVLLEQHLQRLQMGCERLRISQPSREVLSHEINLMVKDQAKAVLKILITRGDSGRGYRIAEHGHSNRIMIRYGFPVYPPEYYRQGVTIRLCDGGLSDNPRLAGIKHLNRLEQILARSEWQDESIAEGLMMDRKGNIIEGTMSNVFLVNEDCLVTPDVTTCGVAGVMRQQVLDTAQDMGISFDIIEVKKQDLIRAKEVFLTNSVIGIWPVKQIMRISGETDACDYPIGPLTAQLMQTLCTE